MSIFKKYHQPQGYTHLEDLEDGVGNDLDINSSVQYNYVPQQGYFFPGSGMNYVIGIDGHRSIVQQKKLTKPTKFVGALFCPCFTAEEPFSEESKIRYRNCLMSFTFVLALAEAIVLGVMLKDGLAPLRENTSVGPSPSTLLHYGAKLTHPILHDNQIWRFFSPTFLHAGVLHAIVNLAILFRLGMYLEREWGSLVFLLSYFVAGVGGTALSCILQPHTIGVGASGAVAGLVIAYGIQLALSFKSLDTFQRRLQVFQFITFLVMVLILMLCPYVDWSNMVGGGCTGLLFGIAIWDLKQERQHHRRLLWIVPATLLIVGFSGAFCYLYLVMA